MTTMPFIVLVCGGREYEDRVKVYITLDALHAKSPVTMIIHGMARGADTLAMHWAIENVIEENGFEAKWRDLNAPGAIIRRRKNGQLYNVKAGHDRNRRMLEIGRPHLVIAFPGGRGTADMVSLARGARIMTMEVK